MLRDVTTPARIAALFLLLASPGFAYQLSVTLAGSHVEAVHAGGVTYAVDELVTGHSTGAASYVDGDGYGVTAADVRNLAFYFSRSSETPEWDVELPGPWFNVNGNAPDFFLFEVGGDDVISVAPRFAGDTYGEFTVLSGWTSSGHVVAHGPNVGEEVHGLSFRSSDLVDELGVPLAPNALITGIRIRSSTVDGAAFFAVDPSPDPDLGLDGDGSVAVLGELRVGQPIEFVFQGPWASETDVSPNPFLDYRLTVVVDGPGDATQRVPGFFDADGESGERGRIWRARFSPQRAGHWTATTSFREGSEIAVSTDAGTPGLLDALTIEFDVAPRDLTATGFLRWGRLEHVGGHYRKFRGGPYFVKGGTNSPENLLAFRGFDEVCNGGGDVDSRLHTYAPHVGDWRPGDPDFASNVHPTDSKGIIGALNYLSSVGVNPVFSLLMNLGGDGQDVHPYVSPADTHFAKTHLDTSRLRQWNIVFEHAARQGIALHFGLAETESANENWLDGGNLGVERKLFYREMVARFGHNPAVKWNFSEENDYSVTELLEFAEFLDGSIAASQLLTFHNHTNDFDDYWAVLGEPLFSGTSLQYLNVEAGNLVESMRTQSAAAGHPWVVEADENGPSSTGLTDSNAGSNRRQILYDVLFSGGGLEWYYGCHDLPLGGDLNVEDFRTREEMWNYMRYARELVERVEFWEMAPRDELLTNETQQFGGGEVFAKPGSAYLVYLPDDSPQATLDLSAEDGTLTKRWYNPRTGSFEGQVEFIQGGAHHLLGAPPSDPEIDWAVLFEPLGSAAESPR